MVRLIITILGEIIDIVSACKAKKSKNSGFQRELKLSKVSRVKTKRPIETVPYNKFCDNTV